MCGLGLYLLPYTLLTLAEANSTHTHAATDSDSNSHIWPMRIPERKHNWLRLFLPKTKTSSHKLNPVFGRNSKKTIQSHLLHVPFDSDADRKEQPTKTLSEGNIEIDQFELLEKWNSVPCSTFLVSFPRTAKSPLDPGFLPTHGQVSLSVLDSFPRTLWRQLVPSSSKPSCPCCHLGSPAHVHPHVLQAHCAPLAPHASFFGLGFSLLKTSLSPSLQIIAKERLSTDRRLGIQTNSLVALRVASVFVIL